MSSEGLDVIVVDDEPVVCESIAELIEHFYAWGNVYAFTDVDEAVSHCLRAPTGVGIFVVDVMLGGKSGFSFLEDIQDKYPMAQGDTIMITGHANDDVVNMCIASGVNYLLEKPIKPYALQLSVRAIVAKYLRFAKKLLEDPELAESIREF